MLTDDHHNTHRGAKHPLHQRGEGISRNLLTVMEDEGVCQFMSGPDSKDGSHNRRRIVEGGKREAGKCKEEGGAGKQGV